MFVEGGACAMAQWHNGQSKPAIPVLTEVDVEQLRWLVLLFKVLTGATDCRCSASRMTLRGRPPSPTSQILHSGSGQLPALTTAAGHRWTLSTHHTALTHRLMTFSLVLVTTTPT